MQMRYLFNKIDVDTDGYIDWDDFSDYMLLRAQGKKLMKEESENQLFTTEYGTVFGLAQPLSTPHRDNILKIHFSLAWKRFLTVSKDGTVCQWSENLKLLRSFKNVGYSLFP